MEIGSEWIELQRTIRFVLEPLEKRVLRDATGAGGVIGPPVDSPPTDPVTIVAGDVAGDGTAADGGGVDDTSGADAGDPAVGDTTDGSSDVSTTDAGASGDGSDGEVVDPSDTAYVQVDAKQSNIVSHDLNVSGVLATFTPALAAGEYSATIDWGDGETSAGVIAAGADGTLSISGAHAYAKGGAYGISVDLMGSDDSSGSGWCDAVVGADPLVVAYPPDLYLAKSGDATEQYLGSFFDAEAADPSAYSVAIQWGDGSSSAGKISDDGEGYFSVMGDHAYAATGAYAVSYTMSKSGGGSLTASGSAEVIDARTICYPLMLGVGDVALDRGDVVCYDMAPATADGGGGADAVAIADAAVAVSGSLKMSASAMVKPSAPAAHINAPAAEAALTVAEPASSVFQKDGRIREIDGDDASVLG